LTWVALFMAWGEGQNLGIRWEQACQLGRELHRHWELGQSYTGFTDALVRKGPTVIAALKRRFQRMMQQKAGIHWRIRGWLIFAVDGTRIEAPHTLENETGLGCAGKNKTAPQVFLTTLWHLGLGLPWDFRVGPGTTSERTHAREMIDSLPERSLLVADAGFVSYAFCRKLILGRHAFLLRVGGNVSLLTKLGFYCEEKDGIVYLWPDKCRNRPPLVLRLIVLTRGKQTVCLLTNILDPEELSDEDAMEIYPLRWGEEVYHRSFKQTLKRRTLLSRTPSTCLAEAQWVVLGLWLLGLMQIMPGIPQHRSPRKWSVARSRDAVRRAMRNDPPGGPRAPRRKSLKQVLAEAMHDSYKRLGSKEARNYPRKKQEKPPGPPKIKLADTKQIQLATQFPPPIIPQRWTA
jgi:IS4 transposase